jgi:cytochrome c oxidase subunit II
MASSPRAGRLSPATAAIIIGAVMIIGALVVVQASGGEPLNIFQRVAESLYPPQAVTQQGAAIRELYTIVFLIAVVIFFVVEGLIVWTVLRYRRRPQDDELPAQTHGNNIAEIVWTVVPTLIVAFLFVVSWNTLNTVDNVSATPETRIRAVAGQFQWKFDYLDESGENVLYTQLLPTGADGGMFVPAGRTVLLTLESPDVIHAFYVPQFLFKRDVVPGRVNKFEFLVGASFAGQTFRGQCAELCGAGHAQMLFDVHALPPADFDAWLAKQVAQANATPPPATPAPSQAPGASPAPGASGAPPASGAPAPSGTVVKISALNIAFEQKEASAPAGVPFQIEFENKDAGVPHNVAIHQGSPTGQVMFQGEVFPGVATKTYDVPALAAGTYAFVCTVHPNMTGTLTVN